MIFVAFFKMMKYHLGKNKIGTFQTSQVEVSSQQATKPQYTSLEKWIKSPGDPKYLPSFNRAEYIQGYQGRLMT